MTPLRAVAIRGLLKLPLTRDTHLDLQERLIRLLYDHDEQEARKVGGDIGPIEGARIFELGYLEEERESYLSARLIREARSLRVPVPPVRFQTNPPDAIEPWQMGSQTREIFLTEQGYKNLRDAIRAEYRARRESRSHRINWITAWTGLLGAIAATIGAYAAILALQSRGP